MLDLIAYSLVAVMGVCWLVIMASAYELVTKHRPEDRSLGHYFQGKAWVGAHAFAPSGASVRRRMHLAVATFFLIAFGLAGVAMLTVVGAG